MFPILPASEEVPEALAISAYTPHVSDGLASALTAAIIAHGGWILEQRAERNGGFGLLYEFSCDASLEMYGLLMSCGLEVSGAGHMQLTSLWMCARNRRPSECRHIARIALTVSATDPG